MGAGAPQRRWTFAAFAGALALFLLTCTSFAPRIVDLGARRILDGEVPYRDFWTIYAPGSFYTVAGAFAVLGRESLVSNLMGVLTSALAVAAFHRLASRLVDERMALLPAAAFTLCFFAAGYHRGFTSYPPAILLLVLAALSAARFVDGHGRRWLLASGACLGLAALYKHDLGAYGCIATGIGLLVTPLPGGEGRIASVARLGGVVLLMLVPPVIALASVAGPEMLRDLVVFPLTDFPLARKENFPGIVPSLDGATGLLAVRRILGWSRLWIPAFLAICAAVALWRRRRDLDPTRRFLIVFGAVSFPIFWNAAHVQINTHQITLVGLAALLAAAAFLGAGASRRRVAIALLILTLWSPAFFAEYARGLLHRGRLGTEFVGLPGFTGIRAVRRDANWMRGLSDALRDAAPPEAPLLVLGERNDFLVFAEGTPYFLSDRPFATAHHELHPAITDTEPVQRKMIERFSAGPLPVLVVEHRFPSEAIDDALVRFRDGYGLPVGATLLDEWVREHYEPSGKRFGMYEVMRPR